MYLWLLIFVATLAETLSHWEPCKVQCDSNFKRNDINQQTALITVCQRGCDLFTVALISTSQMEDVAQQHPKALPQIEKPNAKQKLHSNNNLRSINTKLVESNSITGSSPSIYQNHVSENKNGVTPETAKAQPGTNSNSASKTTVEPSSQPVQDHPVEASKQSTTTNGPRRANLKINKKSETSLNDIKNINTIKQISLTGSNRIDQESKQIKKNETILLKERRTKEKLHKTDTLHEHHDSNFKAKLEQAKHSCRHACVSAYGGASEQEACVVGCHIQATTASLKLVEELPKKSDAQYRTPLAMFQHIFFSLAGHVGRLVRITWSWASSENSKNPETPEKLQVYGSEGFSQRAEMPLFIGLKPGFVEENNRREDSMKNEENHAMKLFSDEFFRLQRPIVNSISINNRQSSPGIITITKEKSNNHHKEHIHPPHTNVQFENKIDDKQLEFEKIDGGNVDVGSLDPLHTENNKQQSHANHDQQQIQHQLDLLECISRKSGLPRWFIAITIFASALVVLWLCFSLTAPPDDIKVVKTKPPEIDGFGDDDDDFDDDSLSCNEKKKLLARADDVIKIRIENV